MPARISRRKLAEYAARELQAGNRNVLRNLAAYLITSRRKREVELLVRDIEAALETSGVVVAQVVSARELSSDIKAHITSFIQSQSGAETVQLSEEVDESVLGGIRVTTPSAEYDNTIKQNINALRALKQ